MPEIYRQSLVRRPVFSLVRLLVRPWPYHLAPAAGESFGAHICPIPCSLCRLMYIHTLMVLQQMLQHSQHQSTARIRVPSGPFGLAEQGLLFKTLLPLQNFSGRVELKHQAKIFVSMVTCNEPSTELNLFNSSDRDLPKKKSSIW